VQSEFTTLKIIYTHIHQPIIEACKTGKRTAQYELYSLYVDAMYNVSLNLVKNKEDAEDVLQESFTNAFKSIERFDYQSTFGAWLKRIVINTSINTLKKKRIFTESFDGQEYKIVEKKTDTGDHGYEVRNVKKAIQTLPPGFRSVLTLYLIEGYDHTEIADILNISVSTSKTQYSRAKKKLKEILNTN